MLPNSILPRDFYAHETTIVAKKLLGKRLVHKVDRMILSGIITETEAYRSDDPASHTYNGITERNKAMFGTVGCAYIYTTMEFILVLILLLKVNDFMQEAC